MNYENFRPSENRLPDVVKNLLIINVIVYVATIIMQGQGLDLIDEMGLHYFLSEKFGLWQFITYMFLHDIGSPGNIAIAHIAMNMLILFMFGPPVESAWGSKRFLKYYIITGIGAALTHYIILYFQIQPEVDVFDNYINASSPAEMSAILFEGADKYSYVRRFMEFLSLNEISAADSVEYARQFRIQLLDAPVMIGASGAIFGILLAYGMLFPNSVLYLFLAIPMKAKYAVIFFGALELYLGLYRTDNVAHFAHLGGIITGLIVIFIWKNSIGRRRNDFYD